MLVDPALICAQANSRQNDPRRYLVLPSQKIRQGQSSMVSTSPPPRAQSALMQIAVHTAVSAPTRLVSSASTESISADSASARRLPPSGSRRYVRCTLVGIGTHCCCLCRPGDLDVILSSLRLAFCLLHRISVRFPSVALLKPRTTLYASL